MYLNSNLKLTEAYVVYCQLNVVIFHLVISEGNRNDLHTFKKKHYIAMKYCGKEV